MSKDLLGAVGPGLLGAGGFLSGASGRFAAGTSEGAPGRRTAGLQEEDSLFLADLSGFVVPEGCLDFTDVAGADQEHTEAGLADAAADGLGEFAV